MVLTPTLTLSKPKRHNVRTMNTLVLEQIVANDGYNEAHTRDYGPQLPEIIDELNRRREKQHKIAAAKLLKKLNDPNFELATHGRTCADCAQHFAPNQVEANFYTKRGKYRRECKDCTKRQNNERRQLAKINLSEIPF